MCIHMLQNKKFRFVFCHFLPFSIISCFLTLPVSESGIKTKSRIKRRSQCCPWSVMSSCHCESRGMEQEQQEWHYQVLLLIRASFTLSSGIAAQSWRRAYGFVLLYVKKALWRKWGLFCSWLMFERLSVFLVWWSCQSTGVLIGSSQLFCRR